MNETLSDRVNAFTNEDRIELEEVAALLASAFA